MTLFEHQEQFQGFLKAFLELKCIFSESQWQNSGFHEFEGLVNCVGEAISLGSDTARFHRLALLRSWMFWLDLSPVIGTKGLGRMLRGYFYVLVFVAVPMFPASYAQQLAPTCVRLARQVQQESEDGEPISIHFVRTLTSVLLVHASE